MSVINPGPHHILLLAQASSGLRDTSLNIEVAWTESKKDEGLGQKEGEKWAWAYP